MYLDLPVVFALLQMHPRLKRWATALGLVIMCLGLALSSFSRNTTHLILTQGIFYAIGGSIAYAPTILYMDEWFVKRKGFAFGIMWVSVSPFPTPLPHLPPRFLRILRLGWHWSLRGHPADRHAMAA